MTIQSIKGFKDILPDEIPPWEFAEAVLRRLFKSFRYLEIRLPVLEETALFDRSIGTGTDIVEKEMYTFDDRDGKRISLRPEGTASVIRAYIEHHLKGTLPLVKLFYMGPMFRHERPQKGRFRQFHQTGAEAIGDSGPLLDAEQIFLLSLFFEEIGIKEARLEINSVGCSNCRPPYKKILQDYLRKKENALCENCRRRIETNPLRVLDCKGESCQEALKDAPEILRYLCEECASHFGEVKKGLEALKIPFWINPDRKSVV